MSAVENMLLHPAQRRCHGPVNTLGGVYRLFVWRLARRMPHRDAIIWTARGLLSRRRAISASAIDVSGYSVSSNRRRLSDHMTGRVTALHLLPVVKVFLYRNDALSASAAYTGRRTAARAAATTATIILPGVTRRVPDT